MPIRGLVSFLTRMHSRRVENFKDPYFKKTVQDLFDTLSDLQTKGWGASLAANQIQYPDVDSHPTELSYPKGFTPPQIYVISKDGEHTAYVNPEFEACSTPIISSEEAYFCGALRYHFPRYAHIRLSAFNEEGEKIIEDIKDHSIAEIHQRQIACLQGLQYLEKPRLNDDEVVDLLVWAEANIDAVTIEPGSWIIPGKLQCLVEKPDFLSLISWCQQRLSPSPLAATIFAPSVDVAHPEMVVVIGGSRGIGLGFVKKYISQGCSVIATYRNYGNLEELKALKKCFPDRVRLYQLDVKDETAIIGFSEKIKEKIDVLILNAGILLCAPGAHPLTDKSHEMRDTMEVNAYAPDNIIRALFSKLLNSNSCVVYISSTLSSVTDNLGGRYHSYRASKAAGNIIMQNWNIELAGAWIESGGSHQTRPCAFPISPGWVQTDMGGPRASLTVEESVSGMASVITAVRKNKQCSLYLYNGSLLQRYPDPLVITKKRDEEILKITDVKSPASRIGFALPIFEEDGLESHPIDDREWSRE